ncbi:hypothetical protein [Elizabethkingia anophelis]|uniref:Uncharacterized protein n=1 Tax=Elizabethkingia anophelis TaxID=1117645 RepID=A0A1T3DUS3_9FLAO|nr:hypothetical protein [Elizabethkingia anophelis]AQW96946.1 hypothetical protein BBD31_03145 [Elizabethkingia anophelis]AQX49255.1 hypothetical protein AYC66_00515 [Elizabethkingia anophelis]AQX87600.1 hypothetical protein AYC67_00520 [Elizabethkingia anophelis]ASV80150.1 hypothetical protein A6J37_16875 [Elizabethkingia anophelis]EHM7982604.1 hypothetical protein [Elizabethkingia anophelis]
MKNTYNPKELLNVKILSTSEDIAIKGGNDRKKKDQEKRKIEIKDRVTIDDDELFPVELNY